MYPSIFVMNHQWRIRGVLAEGKFYFRQGILIWKNLPYLLPYCGKGLFSCNCTCYHTVPNHTTSTVARKILWTVSGQPGMAKLAGIAPRGQLHRGSCAGLPQRGDSRM